MDKIESVKRTGGNKTAINVKKVRKVNLGSGRIALDGWINIDKSPHVWLSKHKTLKRALFSLGLLSEEGFKQEWPKNIIRQDVTKGLPFPNNSVDYLYSSHMLEHLTKKEAQKVVSECFRVLKPLGVLRIVVPDLRILVNKYLERDLKFFGCDQKEKLAQAFMSRLTQTESKKRFMNIAFGLFGMGSPHEIMYDFESLSDMLEHNGFVDVSKKDFGKGTVPDIWKIDRYQDESLYVEARKPANQ